MSKENPPKFKVSDNEYDRMQRNHKSTQRAQTSTKAVVTVALTGGIA